MRGYLVLSCVLLVAFAAKLDLDPLDNLNEDEFEQEFHLDPVIDPEEKLRREEALVENENLIKETNQEYLDGEISWWDEVNEFADLPKVHNHLNSNKPRTKYTGTVSKITLLYLYLNNNLE